MNAGVQMKSGTDAGCGHALRAAVAALALGVGAGASAADSAGSGSGALAHDAAVHWSLLDAYCTECHNVQDWAGGVAFDTMRPEAIADDWPLWEETVAKLRGRLMPPPGSAQPEQSGVDAFVGWMETRLDALAEAGHGPEHVPLHRLNRSEYARSVRALLDLRIDPAELLPPDVKTDGFSNIASGLNVSPAFLDQFIQAAAYVAGRAVAPREVIRADSVSYTAAGDNQNFHIDGLPFGTRGGLLVTHDFPADGEYRFDIGGIGHGLGNLGYQGRFEHAATLILTIDGEEVFTADVGGEQDLIALDRQQAPAQAAIDERFSDIRLPVAAGPREVGVTFLAHTLAESDMTLQAFAPGGGVHRQPVVGELEIAGPMRVDGIGDTPSRERIFICRPESEADEPACAREIIASLAGQAFRGRVDADELERLKGFYRAERRHGDFERGIEAALMGILSSPSFLYRAVGAGERVPDGYRLEPMELATRLSFFLWSQGPDEELIALARSGRLLRPDVLDAQVGRMLADPRSDALVTNFGFEWLEVDELAAVEPDPRLFPGFDRGLRRAFLQELALFLEHAFREDLSVPELLTADYTWLNERLALHYGITNVRGDGFRRVRLEDTNRHGLMGKGAVLMATSFGNRTSPVVRGAWIMENVMGTPPSPPPPDVETDLSEPDEGERLTVRLRLEEHRRNPSCNACHGVIDPLGLALENFDTTGAWRDIDRDARIEIDAGGELADGTPISGPTELREVLLRRPDQFVQTFTRKLMSYATGRPMEYRDMPAVRAIVRQAAAEDYRFSAIVRGIVHSAAFQGGHFDDDDAGADGVSARGH